MPTKKSPEQPIPVICIQEIRTSWTKASRGGLGAVARTRVPKALPFLLPVSVPKMPSLLLQIARFTESYPFDAAKSFQNKYERGLQLKDVAEPYNFRGVSACFCDGHISVEYEYKWEQGMPWRYSTTNDVARLEIGQWCQVLLNVRYSSYLYAYGESNHWYESTFINIGLFNQVETGIFLNTEPVKVYDRMAHLF